MTENDVIPYFKMFFHYHQVQLGISRIPTASKDATKLLFYSSRFMLHCRIKLCGDISRNYIILDILLKYSNR